MKRLNLTRIARTAAVVAASSSMLTLGFSLATVHTASADPPFVTAKVGVGSDTIQDLFNAYNGLENAKAYTPLTGASTQVASYDATPPGSCIAPGSKLGGGQFDRPNGSGDGINALSASIDGAAWQQTRAGQTSCVNPTGTTPPLAGNVTGQIDFSRSSRAPKVLGCTTGPVNCLQFIPFARDALSYAFSGGGADPSFTTAELVSLYTSAGGTLVKNGITWHACVSQSGSGTTGFWEQGVLGLPTTSTQAEAASFNSGCDAGTPGTVTSSSIEENGGDAFNTQALSVETTFGAGNEAVIDFSVGSWIAQANAVAADRSSMARAPKDATHAGVDLGADAAIVCPCPPGNPKPYAGTPGTETPNATFYANTTYGRDLYVVIPLRSCGTVCGSTGLGSAGIKALFVGAGAAICTTANQATANLNGFASFPIAGLAHACGDTSASTPTSTPDTGGRRSNLRQ